MPTRHVSNLSSLFQEALADEVAPGRNDVYRARPIQGHLEHFIAASPAGEPTLLFPVSQETTGIAPIFLQHLSVRPSVHCTIRSGAGSQQGHFAIVSCSAVSIELREVFLRVGEVLLASTSEGSSSSALSSVVARLVDLFQCLQAPPKDSVIGLFGELFVISRAKSPKAALDAWHPLIESTFDFSWQCNRLEVKTTSSRVRIHDFSYEQCVAPDGTTGLLASIQTEEVSSGKTVFELAESILMSIDNDVRAEEKLHNQVARTLGTSFESAAELRFDEVLARNSCRFFNLAKIPAVRADLAPGVSGVRFRSDLSQCEALSFSSLKSLVSVGLEVLPSRI